MLVLCKKKDTCPKFDITCTDASYATGRLCFETPTEATESHAPSGQMNCLVMPQFDRKEYIEKLWSCYQKGINDEGLQAEDLFKALVSDLLEQVVDGKTERA